MKKIMLLVVLLFAPAAWACFQIGDSPVTLHNTDIKVHFAYAGKGPWLAILLLLGAERKARSQG